MNEVDEKQLILEQYKAYLQKLDRFTDRSFTTNKFFMVLIIILFLLAGIFFHKLSFQMLTLTMVFCIIGMSLCVLWWANADTYDFFTKIKLQKVVDKFEELLPVNSHALEKQALDEIRAKKKIFLFSDVQKLLAVMLLILFLIIFINDVVMFIMAPNMQCILK